MNGTTQYAADLTAKHGRFYVLAWPNAHTGKWEVQRQPINPRTGKGWQASKVVAECENRTQALIQVMKLARGTRAKATGGAA